MKTTTTPFILLALLASLTLLPCQGFSQSWSYVGSAGLSALNPTGHLSKIFFDANGALHMGYIRGTSASTVTILKFDSAANSWNTLTEHALNRVATDIDFDVDANGDLYIAYQASIVSERIYRVKKYSGGNWSFMGDSIRTFNFSNVDVQVLNNDVYFSANRKVHKWDASNSTWQEIHTVAAGNVFIAGRLAVDTAQQLHLLTCLNRSLSVSYFLKLEKYDGTNWTDVGDTTHIPNAVYLHLLFNNANQPVAAFGSSAGLTPNHHIIKWDGSSWDDVADLSVSPNSLIFTAAANAQGHPLFAASNYGGTVYEFDGTAFVKLDSATGANGLHQIYDLAVSPTTGTRYMLLAELNSNASGTVLSVMAYTGGASSVAELPAAPDFGLYPNPATGLVQLNALPARAQVMITDLSGKKMFDAQAEGTTLSVDLTQFQAGVYLVRVAAQGSLTTKKLIVLQQ